MIIATFSMMPTSMKPLAPLVRSGLAALAGLALCAVSLPSLAEVASRARLQVINVAADDVLNLRQAPHAKAPLMGDMPPGSQEVITVGPSQGDWLYVRHGFLEGWARARYLAVVEPGVAPQPLQGQGLKGLVIGIRSGSSLALRSAPQANATRLARLAPGSQSAALTGLAEPGWLQVSLNGQLGWVEADHMLVATGGDDHGENWQCGGTEPFWGLRLIGNKLRYTNLDGTEINALGTATTQGNFTALQSSSGVLRADILYQSAKGGQACSDGMSDIDYPFYIRAQIGPQTYEGCCQLGIY